MRLYKLAWYLHFKEIVRRVSAAGDTVYVIAASLNTNRKEGSARDALEDVCRQLSTDREIILCV